MSLWASVWDTTRAAGAEVLAPGEHDQIDVVLMGDRDGVVGGESESTLEADAIVRGGDVAGRNSRSQAAVACGS